MNTRLLTRMITAIAIFLILGLLLPQPAMADGTLVVNTVDDVDDGSCSARHCSLREAIIAANNMGGSTTIEFNIPGEGPHIISLCQELPVITASRVMIDGTSEPDYAGTPVVVLEPHFNLDAVGEDVTHGIRINADLTIVRGLSIVYFRESGFSPTAAGIVLLGGEGIRIEDNYLGLMPDGAVRGNNSGVMMYDGEAVIDGNVVSGNGKGVFVLDGIVTVTGNRIGTNPAANDGGGAYGNIYGIAFRFDAPIGSTVGGSTPEDRNIISGNYIGVIILSDGVVVQGNYIGTDRTGTASIRNMKAGISVDGDGNLIGGSTPEAGNLISGNTTGVSILGDNNMLMNNWVGLNVEGTDAILQGRGIRIRGNLNVIGPDNVIAGSQYGICLEDSAMLNHIYSNILGVGFDGETAIPYGSVGIDIAGADENIIGGSLGAGNIIRGYSYRGIEIRLDSLNNAIRHNTIEDNGIGVALPPNSGGPPRFNTISENRFAGNAGLGIDLGWPGVNINDPGDTDSGQNDLLNRPEASASGLEISGTACPGCIVELFIADDDPSGYGEGMEFITSTFADSSGNFSLSAGTSGMGVCKPLTLTATDPEGNTSEFSENLYGGRCFHMRLPWIVIIIAAIIGGGGALGRLAGGGRLTALGAGLGTVVSTGLVVAGIASPYVVLDFPQRQPAQEDRPPLCLEVLIPGSLVPEEGAVFETYDSPTLTWSWSEDIFQEGLLTQVELYGPGGIALSRTTSESSMSFAAFDVIPSPGDTYLWSVTAGLVHETGSFEALCVAPPVRTFQMGEQPTVDLTQLEPPTEMPSATATPTVTPTPEPEPITIIAIQNTTCRYGPDTIYEEEGYLLEGETALILGKNLQETWWWIENPDWSGNCWVWGGSGEVIGDTSQVPVIQAPPTPTPEGLVCRQDLGPNECAMAGGTYTSPLNRAPYCLCP